VRDRENYQKMEERRQELLNSRGKILEKFKLEKEQRMQWLVRFIDIEDELEELAQRQNQEDYV